MDRRPSPAPASSPLPSLDEVRTEGPTPPEPRGPEPGASGRRMVSLTVAAGVAAVAGGAVYAADAPVCGTTRVDELQAHASTAAQSLRRGDVSQTVREIGLALGWVRHTTTTPHGPIEPDIPSPGEAPTVTTAPLESPPIHRPGAEMRVNPTPPPVVDGAVPRVQPTPPRVTAPPPGAPPRVQPSSPHDGRVQPHPESPVQIQGGISSVTLHPAPTTRRG